MHKILLYILLSFSFGSVGQTSKIKVKKKSEKELRRERALKSMLSIDGYFGNIIYKDGFYGQLNTGAKFKLSSPPQTVGVGITGHNVVYGPTYSVFEIDAHKILPCKIIINDSVKADFSGAILGFGIGKWLERDNFSMTVYLGFNAGRCIIKNNENISLQKPFFCPKISLHPKVTIKRVALSIMITAQGDITSAKWISTRVKKNNEILITGFYQTGVTAMFGLGYTI